MNTEADNDIQRIDDDIDGGVHDSIDDGVDDGVHDIGGDDSGTRMPSREVTAVVGVIAAAALSLLGAAGAAALGDAAVASMNEAPPPPGAVTPPKTARTKSAKRISPLEKPSIDRSGRKRFGKASFYARMFAGRKMADGNRMRPTGNNAASLTLPLGTTAQVTNLQTGKTAVVTIQDRGPYVGGRIVDLSPATARQIGLDRRTGVTEVEVAPITVPQPDGHIKLGDGALQANNLAVTTNLH
jgi:rare lipoprotein A